MSLCSVTYMYVVELFTYQKNPSISRLKRGSCTLKVLSNKRVFFEPTFSFHIPFKQTRNKKSNK